MFSIILNSVDHVKTLNLPHDKRGGVLIEGFLGPFRSIRLTEGIMLEVEGNNGVLRMDINENELNELLINKVSIN